MAFSSPDEVVQSLRGQQYLADRGLAVACFLSVKLGRPLFLEGEAGVGKTEVAKALASILDEDLIRLQCYEGLDVSHALYEWDYARQMLAIRLIEARGEREEASVSNIMSREFLVPRPLLQAVEAGAVNRHVVLLIDEIDRADEEFEAYLLELLSDFQISIPEIGTIKAEVPPLVVVTSNRTREIHDAVKRRCVYHWIDYPDFVREAEIVKTKVPGIEAALAEELARAMVELRRLGLYKPPGVAETLDWAAALRALEIDSLSAEVADETIGVVLKYREDIDAVRNAGHLWLEQATSAQ